jgi:Mrp family chromosome partitioning ATPase/uncharacterized protein involved in exopolysaccharide biosynthesis
MAMDEFVPETRLLPGARGPAPAPAYPHGDDSVSIKHILGVLRRHYRLILVLTVLGTGIGAFLGFTQPPEYDAVGTVRMALERRSLTGDIERPTPDASRNADPLVSAAQLILSRSVLAAVVDTLGLQLVTDGKGDFPTWLLTQRKVDPRSAGDSILVTFTPDSAVARLGDRQASAPYGQVLRLGTVRFAVAGPPGVPSTMLYTQPRDVAIDNLRQRVVVVNRENSDVIDVYFRDRDPRLAQAVVNGTIQAYRSLTVASAVAKSRRRREFLEEQLTATDSLLKRAQADLAAFRSRQQLASSQSALAATQNALVTLDARKAELEADRTTFRALQGQLQSSDEAVRGEALRALASSPAIADNPEVGNLYRQLTNYQYRLDSMRTGPFAAAASNPDVAQLRTLIGTTQTQLVQTVGSHLASLDARIASLGHLRDRNGASLQVLPAMAEEEFRLNRRVDALSNIGDKIRGDYQGARMAEEVEAGDIDIVDLSSLPYTPVWQTATLKLSFGFLLGLLLGGGLSFLLEALNTSIRRPEDVETLLHVPGLAVIPRLTAVPSRTKPRLAGLLGSSKKSADDGGRSSATFGTATQPFDIGTEAFRMLRTSLVWAEGGERLRTLVVTSPAPGEGKTLTSANLGVTFAHDGLKVLLIDCDIRRPKLHRVFKVPRGPGLIDLLWPADPRLQGGIGTFGFQDDAPAGPALESMLRSTPIRGLTLLTCGAMPTNPTNLLSGVRMRALLQELVQRFDLVILDTPPVLATADARILGGLTDGVLLVVRAGQTDRVAAQRAQTQLTQAGARLLGVVLNDPGGEISGEGDYYYPYKYAAEAD